MVRLTKEYLSQKYRKIFYKTHDDFITKIKNPKRRVKNYSLFYPQIGLNYKPNYTGLLFVGRALNGEWSMPFTCNGNNRKAVLKSISFSKEAAGHCPLEWIHQRRDLKMFTSPFWNVTRKISQNYFSLSNGNWTNNIAWSNLYKISPTNGGNPVGEEWVCQFENCMNLFNLEIEELKPKTIIMITNHNWADGFVDSFNIITENKKGYVAGYGSYNGSQLLITVRPERKPTKAFVASVLNHLV